MVYRLYDLRDGSAIFQNEATFTVNVTEDPAVTIKFPILSPGKFKGASILAWTTTPWTLPSNKALVLDPKEDYVLAKVQQTDVELEQAWLVTKLPTDLNKMKRSNITQAYLANYTDDSGKEIKHVRIRKHDDKYTFTVKYWAGSHEMTGNLLEQTEEVSKERYIELIKQAANKVVKIRYYYPLTDGLTAEIDERGRGRVPERQQITKIQKTRLVWQRSKRFRRSLPSQDR